MTGKRTEFVVNDAIAHLIRRDDAFVRVEVGADGGRETSVSAYKEKQDKKNTQALFSAVESLYIRDDTRLGLRWQDDIESSQWLELLYPFSTVKGLFISQEFVPRIAPALLEPAWQRVTEALVPALRALFLEKPPPSGPVHEIHKSFPFLLWRQRPFFLLNTDCSALLGS